MYAAVKNMLLMQDRMNTRVHPEWVEQRFEWYRAIWIECGELIDHAGYKWWKQQHTDWEQVQLEIVDIWHFGLSALFRPDTDIDSLARRIELDLHSAEPEIHDLRLATEALALDVLQTKSFSIPLFAQLMVAGRLDFDALYRQYVGKNVLNFFRQDHGYKEGTYQKVWQGREDNEHLAELMLSLDASTESFPDDVYAELSTRYRTAI